MIVVFVYKHKTAYEMRISDWSSDVCSSDLLDPELAAENIIVAGRAAGRGQHGDRGQHLADQAADAVDAEHVERIVEAQLRLDLHHEPAAGDAGDRAQEDGAERPRIARGGGDRDEAGDRTRTGHAQRTPAAARAHGAHADATTGRPGVREKGGHDGLNWGVGGR